MEVGDELRVRRRTLEIRAVATRVEERAGVVEHVTELRTREVPRRGRTRAHRPTANVVRMPAADHSVVGQFIRYHVLVRVFDGDADAWLEHLRAQNDAAAEGDIRFVHWIRSRLRHDPTLLASIRRMVDATPFWRRAVDG